MNDPIAATMENVPALGQSIRLVINQQRRTLVCVEAGGFYSLAIYSMPAGRAFLARVWKVAGSYAYKPASKAERTRHALALALTEIDNSYDLEDAASDCRSYRVATRRQRDAIRFRCKVTMALAQLVLAGAVVPAAQLKDVRESLAAVRELHLQRQRDAQRSNDTWSINDVALVLAEFDAALAKLPLDTAP